MRRAPLIETVKRSKKPPRSSRASTRAQAPTVQAVRRQRLQQAGQPPGRNDGDAGGLQQAPRDAGAMHGGDRGDLDLGDAQGLVGLLRRP